MELATVRLICGSHSASGPGEAGGGIIHGLCVLRDADEDLLAPCRPCTPTWVLGRGQAEGESRDSWSWWRLRRVIQRFGPDLVHARSTGVWLDSVLATLGRQPVRLLLSFHGRTHLRPPGRLRRRLNRWAAARADAVLSVSREAAHMMHREYGVPEHKLQVIPNGVDVQRFRPEEDQDEIHRTRRRLRLSGADHVVICVANLQPIKGIDVLLRAWRQVCMADPSARLMIVGAGPLRRELERLTEDLRCGPTVRFLGFRKDVPELLRCADLFVLPSRYEACNNAVVEAMSSGLAVVASDVGGMRELITPNRTGWLVPPDTPDRLAETILAVLLDGPARRRIGAGARTAAVNQFTLETWVSRYASLYRELVDRSCPQSTTFKEDLACAG